MRDLLSGWETFLLMAPFVGLLVLAVFGLDGEAVRHRRSSRGRRTFCEVQPGSGGVLRDPDGQIWNPDVHRQGFTSM
jgi:hypothetical protein